MADSDLTHFTALYEHIMPDALPRLAHEMKAGKYESARSCSVTIALVL